MNAVIVRNLILPLLLFTASLCHAQMKVNVFAGIQQVQTIKHDFAVINKYTLSPNIIAIWQLKSNNKIVKNLSIHTQLIFPLTGFNPLCGIGIDYQIFKNKH